MSDDREERIRNHAYRLWEEEGHPDGRHDDHWRDATAAVDGNDSDDAAPPEPSNQLEVQDEAAPMTPVDASPTEEESPAPVVVPAPPPAAAKRTAAAAPRRRKTPAKP